MAEVAIKSLASGQLANSKGEIYPCPSATQAIIQSIILVNTNSSAETLNIYFKESGGSSLEIIPVDTSLAAGAKMECLDKPLNLEAADILEGDTTTASKVNFIITGIENS